MGDFGLIMDDLDRLDDLDCVVRRLRLTEPFDKQIANERIRALAGVDEELSP